MSQIKPFKGIIYNQNKIKDLSLVVCPPYDVISPVRQQHYHDIDPHNLIHILLGKEVPGENKYRRAAAYFKDWLKKEILVRDQSPAIYFYSQQYKIRGEQRTRLGFISLLQLKSKNSGVFVHEHTRRAPKEDRFKLMKQVKANLSPIFVVFLDKKRIIQRTYEQYIQGRPAFIELADDEKTVHKLWRLDSPELLDNIQKGMSGEDIFIADGHHRYEVAGMYRDLMVEKLGENAASGEESFNYVLSYFTNTDARGLLILPIHRLLKLEEKLDFEAFMLKLKAHFDVEEVRDKTRFFFLMEKGGRTEHVLGMYKNKKYWLLRLKNVRILDKMISDKPKEYRSLDVSILNHIILKETLGYDAGDKESLEFNPHAEELIEAVDNNPNYIGFFLNPVKIGQIISLALKGERMPPKSTYFYPKVLSGLAINKLD